MLCVLIMAGGKGTRFFPASTEKKPKQFLKLLGEKTMLQMTVDRFLTITDINHIFICSGQSYNSLILEQIPQLPKNNIINEPESKNTAPCILLSTLYINSLYPDSTILVVPSDHKINDVDGFINIIKEGNSFIENNKNSIITIGISPTRPETGYGYIKIMDNSEKKIVKKVERFVEKPNFNKANEYYLSGKYLWNAGMFLFNTHFMLSEMEKYMKDTFDLLKGLPYLSKNFYGELEKVYKKCDSISVDYAIMEKSKNIYVIAGDIGWDDVGNWLALERYIDSDELNNVLKGDVAIFDSSNNIVFGDNKKIVLLGVENLFCIDSDEMIVIGNKKELANVHKLKEDIK